MVPSGALPAVQSPEETGLVNVDVTGDKAGIWYLSHFKSEWEKNTAVSTEDKRDIGATHYKIDTEVAKGGALSATTEMEFTAVSDGARVLRVDLLPTLRMKRVTDGKGREILFLQESTKADDSFHVLMPEPLEAGRKYTLRFEYEGNKVLRDEGGGNYSVGARSSWYPNVNSFMDHATYELKFRSPRQYTLVSVGKLISEARDGSNTVSQWKSDIPLAVAGFNYGDFKKKSISDPEAKYDLEVYTTSNVPSVLREFARGHDADAVGNGAERAGGRAKLDACVSKDVWRRSLRAPGGDAAAAIFLRAILADAGVSSGERVSGFDAALADDGRGVVQIHRVYR